MYVRIYIQLYHMLYWKNVPPAIALSYFYKEYASHSTTAKFAAKTLQRFKPVRCVTYCSLTLMSVITALRYVCMKFSCYNVFYCLAG